MEWISPSAFHLFKQSFLTVHQRIVFIKPLVGIEFSELETNLLPLFLSELGQLGVVRMKIGLSFSIKFRDGRVI
jgi:hypothetical protein